MYFGPAFSEGNSTDGDALSPLLNYGFLEHEKGYDYAGDPEEDDHMHLPQSLWTEVLGIIAEPRRFNLRFEYPRVAINEESE